MNDKEMLERVIALQNVARKQIIEKNEFLKEKEKEYNDEVALGTYEKEEQLLGSVKNSNKMLNYFLMWSVPIVVATIGLFELFTTDASLFQYIVIILGSLIAVGVITNYDEITFGTVFEGDIHSSLKASRETFVELIYQVKTIGEMMLGLFVLGILGYLISGIFSESIADGIAIVAVTAGIFILVGSVMVIIIEIKNLVLGLVFTKRNKAFEKEFNNLLKIKNEKLEKTKREHPYMINFEKEMDKFSSDIQAVSRVPKKYDEVKEIENLYQYFIDGRATNLNQAINEYEIDKKHSQINKKLDDWKKEQQAQIVKIENEIKASRSDQQKHHEAELTALKERNEKIDETNERIKKSKKKLDSIADDLSSLH